MALLLMEDKCLGGGITLMFMSPVSAGNSVTPVNPQQSASGNQGKELDMQLVVKSAENGTLPQPSSQRQISHEYSQDGDRMQCEVCGCWYHII